jgi:Fe-S cluster assembly iron-binding protein IscA
MHLTITPAAAQKLRAELAESGEPGDAIRLTMNGPEILSPRYALDTEPPRPGDEVLDLEGLLITASPESTERLRGYTIDAHDEGFEFIPPRAG